MKKILIFLLCSFAISVYADVTQQSGKVRIQNISAPALYVFCNKKDLTLVLDRVEFDNPGVSAGWSSELSPHTCSIFLANKSPFIFSCSEALSGGLNLVDCKNVTRVGPLTWNGKMLSGEKMVGSYWVAESISVEDVTLVARHRGFDL